MGQGVNRVPALCAVRFEVMGFCATRPLYVAAAGGEARCLIGRRHTWPCKPRAPSVTWRRSHVEHISNSTLCVCRRETGDPGKRAL